jgi:myosin heavy subunit
MAHTSVAAASEFHYVNQSDCTEIEGVSDSDTFQKTRKAMTVVGISDERQLEIFKLLAAVLHLGNWKKSTQTCVAVRVRRCVCGGACACVCGGACALR